MRVKVAAIERRVQRRRMFGLGDEFQVLRVGDLVPAHQERIQLDAVLRLLVFGGLRSHIEGAARQLDDVRESEPVDLLDTPAGHSREFPFRILRQVGAPALDAVALARGGVEIGVRLALPLFLHLLDDLGALQLHVVGEAARGIVLQIKVPVFE